MTGTDAVNASLAALAEAVNARIAGEQADVESAAARLLDLVAEHSYRDSYVSMDANEIAARRMKEMRTQANYTQEALGTAMRNLGFAWKRTTVAETEVGRRRLSIDEMTGLALAFNVPVIEFLSAKPGEAVQVGGAEVDQAVFLDSVELTHRQFNELVIGRGGSPGTGGPAWRVAAPVAKVQRPARDLWKARRAEVG